MSAGPDGLRYRCVRALTRLLLKLFYARIEVVGAERVPATGPLIVAANHHNSIVDAMLLLVAIPRPMRTLANAPLFRHPLIGPFLRLIGALPVHPGQVRGERRRVGIEAQRNDVDLSAPPQAGQFACIQEHDPSGGAGLRRRLAAGHRVVVGQRQQLHGARGRERDQLRRAEHPVGPAAVRVQVDALERLRGSLHGRHHSEADE